MRFFFVVFIDASVSDKFKIPLKVMHVTGHTFVRILRASPPLPTRLQSQPGRPQTAATKIT